jgi:hypothetical protein
MMAIAQKNRWHALRKITVPRLLRCENDQPVHPEKLSGRRRKSPETPGFCR